MKIQKVEIQAFRAYDKVENGTFDFSIKHNEVADFISIYGPNGFGKTSFYDAVEWAYTNRVSRFDRKHKFNKDLAKSERDFLSENSGRSKQWIIRNKYSELEEGYVRLFTTSRDKPFENIIPKVGKGSSDYKFGSQKRKANREYFHEVLLSQEFIDAFLKEDDAHLRYKKFIQSFGDVELDKKYRTIVDIIKINDSKIKSLNNALKGVQLSLNLDFDKDLLTNLNVAIEKFNAKDEGLPKVDPNFTEKDVLRFADLISGRRHDLNAEIRNLNERNGKVNDSISGKQGERLSLEGYFEAKAQINSLNLQLIRLEKQKDSLEKCEQIRVQISELEKELAEQLEEDKSLTELIKIYPNFAKLNEAITKEELQIVKSKKAISESSLDEIVKEIDELTASISSKQSNYQKLSDRSKQLPEVLKKLSDLDKELKALAESKRILNENLEKVKASIANQESKISARSAFKQNIDNGIYPTKESEFYEQYGELISTIVSARSELKEVESNFEKVREHLSDTDMMNQELKELVERGATIINRSQSSSCPLCKQEYQSFAVLAERISNNPMLSQRINELLEQKSRWEVEQNRLIKLINESSDNLKRKVNEELEEESDSLKALTEHHDSLNRSINELNKKNQLLKATINEYLQALELTNHPTEDFEAGLQQETEAAKFTLDEVLNSIKRLSAEKNKIEEQVQLLNSQAERSAQKIQNLKKESEYQQFISFRIKSLMEDFPTKEVLNTIQKTLRLKVSEINRELDKLNTLLKQLNDQLKGVDKGVIESAIAVSESKIETLRTKIHSFENLLKSFVNIPYSDLSKDELLEVIEQEREETLEAKKLKEEKLVELEKIDAYKENVIPFLEYQENQVKKSELEAEKFFLMNVVSKELKSEKKRISEFIHKQVESFFYQNLINTLYQKIDPHPSYKEISFKCDFSSTQPTLNIFVSDGTQNTIVPTLYFSTAQLNILSLSIFLAKAINVKNDRGEPVDCIFIDDPIQSMDSINILSTIDLFRSIVLNLNKQIILSTHDQNFQNLLKKKIPTDLFPAKYLELETFGTVKASE